MFEAIRGEHSDPHSARQNVILHIALCSRISSAIALAPFD